MKLYNSLLAEQELDNPKTPLSFTPLQDNQVRMYSCGPTVYDHAHIGNLSAYIFADTLRRVLKVSGFDVKHVMNYTDVDDKTISRSAETYPSIDPREALRQLTDKYIQLFLKDMKSVGNDVEAMQFVRATDKIVEMKQLITDLLRGNFAYVADDGIYFSIEAYKNGGYKYGQLSQIDANTTSAARISNDEYDKDELHDFALWKKQKGSEPSWEFTVDGVDMRGRPGWHIECSAMSREALGQPFDIHTGGVDLKFPHHENEIAQSTALSNSDKRMAQFFCHNEHILIDGRKMAKSSNNFYTLEDILNKGYDPLTFRLLILQSHYRNQVNFTWESLDSAKATLHYLRGNFSWIYQVRREGESPLEQLPKLFGGYKAQILEALQDDLSTPRAVMLLNKVSDAFALAEGFSKIDIPIVEDFASFVDQALGINILDETVRTTDYNEIIKERETARSNKDWAKADELRNILLEKNVEIKDSADQSYWYWRKK
jgi:cysteinyl-tRNA synthetase